MASPDQVVAVLGRRRLTLLVTFVLVLSAVAVVTFSLPDVYRTTAYIWVGSNDETLLNSYAELLQTRGVAVDVNRALPFTLDVAAVQAAVQIEPVGESQLISIAAEGRTPGRAKALADTYTDVVLDRSARLNLQNGNASRVTLAEAAPPVDTPVRPRPLPYLLLGAVLAAFLAVVMALLRQRFDQRLEIGSSTTEILDLPIIGRIPQSPASSPGVESDDEVVDQQTEAFRLLLANLAFTNGGELPRSVSVVSARESEGKSTCCAGMGRAAAERDIVTVLVDGDLRRPALSSMLGTEAAASAPGFSNLLLRGSPLAMNEVALPTSSGLNLIPSGPLPPSPAALLASTGLANFERRARNHFGFIVYDTPPLSFAADGSLISAAVEGTVLVVDARKTGRSAVVQAVDQLRRANANVLGVIVNRLPESRQVSYYTSKLR